MFQLVWFGVVLYCWISVRLLWFSLLPFPAFPTGATDKSVRWLKGSEVVNL